MPVEKSTVVGSTSPNAPLIEPKGIEDVKTNLFSRVWLSRFRPWGVELDTIVEPAASVGAHVASGEIVKTLGEMDLPGAGAGTKLKAGVVGVEVKSERQFELEAVLLDRDSKETARLQALTGLMELVGAGEIVAAKKIPESNNHIHTWASFSPYSPAAAVWASYLTGLEVTGKIDHDTVAGNKEFLAAARICGVKATTGMELRVNASDDEHLRKLIWNNPGMPNVTYFIAHAIPEANMERFHAEVAQEIMGAKDRRNRTMIMGGSFEGFYQGRREVIECKGVNGLLADMDAGFALDYDKEVVPLTYREGDETGHTGNATDRHLMVALAQKINEHVSAGDKVEFMELLAGRQLSDAERGKLGNVEDFKDVLRSALLKPMSDKAPKSVLITPDEKECPNIKTVSRKITELGGLPVYAYLGDKSTDEDENLEEIIEYCAQSGVKGLAIMPHRNTPEQIQRVTALAEQYSLLIISGVDINRKEMPLIHHRASAKDYPGFRRAALAMIGHERLSVFGDAGYSSNALTSKLPEIHERTEFLAKVGSLKGLTEQSVVNLQGKGADTVIGKIQDALTALGDDANLEETELSVAA